MTDPTPEPSPEGEDRNASPTPPPVDPQEVFKAISGIDIDTIDNDIESAFGSRMAELDKMLAGLDDLVDQIEKNIQNLERPEPDSRPGPDSPQQNDYPRGV